MLQQRSILYRFVLGGIRRSSSTAGQGALITSATHAKTSSDHPKTTTTVKLSSSSRQKKPLFVQCGANAATSVPARVIKLDKQFIIVNKPNNILSQPDSTGDESLDESVERFLKEHYNKPGNAFVAVVHRLDRPVSGLTVLATTSKAASRLAEQIRQRQFKKDYLAVVPVKNLEGRRDGEILGETEDETLVWKHVYTARNSYAVLHVRITSGKKHQIRRQLAHKGIGPVIGDLRFNSTFQSPREFPPSKGVMLHASKLSFIHPTRPEEIVEATCAPPWPEEFIPPFFEFERERQMSKRDEERRERK